MRRQDGPALTVDGVWVRWGRILLVRRGREPFRGAWALPGGFVDREETVEQAVAREVREETGLSGRPYATVGVYSGPHRDPRRSTATVAFLMTGPARHPVGGDDAREAAWVPLADAHGLAFDHDVILRDSLRLLGRKPRRGGRAPARRPR
ncbi:MAG: NUDIX hydrolase [Thermoplasmata archaeon]|nr:NUDIX hydrolase [Thermoplasmata archaeon]